MVSIVLLCTGKAMGPTALLLDTCQVIRDRANVIFKSINKKALHKGDNA